MGLPDDALASIAALCRLESFPSGATICAEGHRADRIHLLQDGKVGLLVHPTSLPNPLTIMVLKSPGQAFGWSAVVGRGYYTAQVRSLSHVHLISIDGRELLGYLEQHPAVGYEIMKRVAETVSGRLRTMRTLVLETAFD
jgi:CRP-like cAMP-binding protein